MISIDKVKFLGLYLETAQIEIEFEDTKFSSLLSPQQLEIVKYDGYFSKVHNEFFKLKSAKVLLYSINEMSDSDLELLQWNKDFVNFGKNILSEEADILRSWEYAIPYLHYSVEDQISNNWIKIIE